MDLILNKKSLPLLSLFLLSLLLLWWMRPLGEEFSGAQLFLSIEPVSEEESLRQALEESASTAMGGGENEPDLRDKIEQAKSKLSKSDYKAAKSNYQRMLEHKEKLEKYKKDPHAFDNQGILRNAPNEQVRQQIIESRIAHLEREIQTFYNNIAKIIGH
jgi:hypothetical protein